MTIPLYKKKAIEQIKDTEETIARLNSGKFTFGSMFQSEKGKKESVILKEALKTELQQDVLNYDLIHKILIIYLSTLAIPAYQKQAKVRYIV